MDFPCVLDEALALVMQQCCPDAVRVAAAAAEETGGAGEFALVAFLGVLAGDTDAAVGAASRARAASASGEAEATIVAGASAFVAAAVGEDAAGYDPGALLDLLPGVPVADRVSAFARYLAVESALAAARIDVAIALMPERSPHRQWQEHPFGAVMAVCRARVAAFAARIDDAAEAMAAYDDATPGLGGALVRATRTLIAGNSGDRDQLARRVESTLAMVRDVPIEPIDHIGRGIHLLVSYGVVALGDKTGAAHALLRAGGDACLSHLVLIDRAIGLETLTAAALEVEDVEAARGWVELARPLAVHRAAFPAVSRAEARLALGEERAADALEWARGAYARSAAESRGLEAAESQILMSRALIALGEAGEATAMLRATVAAGDAEGFGAVRHSASRTLRTVGRRLPPVNGGGWSALSRREREVAEMLVAGAEPGQAATELFLSPATVRVHTSRVLAAFGVASRIGLLGAVRKPPAQPNDLPQLTPRQREVATLIALDHSNAAIADGLGVSVKAVEAHVAEIRRRLGVETRFAVALRWWSAQA